MAPRRPRTDRGAGRDRRTQAQCHYNENLIALGDRDTEGVRRQRHRRRRADEGAYVLFLTSRGLKHYFTGFLHVPPGGDPTKFFEFDDKPPSQLVRYDKDWYFVAN